MGMYPLHPSLVPVTMANGKSCVSVSVCLRNW